MLRWFYVTGPSMQPNLQPGDVFITLAPSLLRPIKRRIVVVDVPGDTPIVKRVQQSSHNGGLILTSDNKDTLSRYCGVPVEPASIQGVKLFKLPYWLTKLLFCIA